MSYISWYVLGGMSLTCLPIFAWQWGRKQNNTEKNEVFWVKPHSCHILWQQGVFSFTKVCIFLPMVFIQSFITTLCVYDFCKTVLVKKCTPCQGVVWFSLPNAIFLHWLFSTYTIEAPWSLRTSCKKSRGRCPRALAGAYVPRTLRTQVLKKWPPSKLVFAVRTSPKVYQIYTGFLTCLA